jgi:hypothetical protein
VFSRYILRWNFICFSIWRRKANVIESWVCARLVHWFSWLFKWARHNLQRRLVLTRLRLVTSSSIGCVAAGVRTFLCSISPIQFRITIDQVSIGLDWLLLRLDLLGFGSILYALYLFYILKLQQLLVDGILHNFVFYYQLLNITGWNIHLLLIIKIIRRLCIKWPMSILPSLYHLLLIRYKNRRYRRKVSIHRNWMKIRSFLMILTFWRLLVLTLNQVLSTCWLLSALKSIFAWHALAAAILVLGELCLTDHVVRMHLKRSRT